MEAHGVTGADDARSEQGFVEHRAREACGGQSLWDPSLHSCHPRSNHTHSLSAQRDASAAQRQAAQEATRTGGHVWRPHSPSSQKPDGHVHKRHQTKTPWRDVCSLHSPSTCKRRPPSCRLNKETATLDKETTQGWLRSSPPPFPARPRRNHKLDPSLLRALQRHGYPSDVPSRRNARCGNADGCGLGLSAAHGRPRTRALTEHLTLHGHRAGDLP